VLNRYGLFETDSDLRGAERQWKQSGTPEDRQGYVRALRRTGDSKQADHLHMEPHVKEWEAADHEHREALMGSAFRTSHQGRLATARGRRMKAARNMHSAAAEIGRHHGEFIEKREGRAPRDHALRLGTLSAGDRFATSRFTSGASSFAFGTPSAADNFHASLEHHYPHWKPERRQIPGMTGFRSEVRFNSGDEWGQPHKAKKD
jgi:hypothetical protein